MECSVATSQTSPGIDRWVFSVLVCQGGGGNILVTPRGGKPTLLTEKTRLDQFLTLAVKGAAPFSSSNQLILFE
jgi:hypothetical protein